jgi:hypothetical protein
MTKSVKGGARKDEPSVLARMVSTGLAALFLTEGGIRKGLKPLGMPRDASKYLLRQVERRKDEMMQMIRDEIHQALAKVPFDRIAKDILTHTDIELNIRFIPRRDGGPKKHSYRWKSKSG